MNDTEATSRRNAAYGTQQRPIVQGNTCEDHTALDELPNPSNPLELDGSGFDGLDRILRCVAISAHTLRDMGYPEKSAWELVLAAKHVKRCMVGVDKVNKGLLVPAKGETSGKVMWSNPLRNVRCCTTVTGTGQKMEV